MPGALERLTLTSGVVKNGKFQAGAGNYSVMINPASYRHERRVTYATAKRLGAAANDDRFAAVDAEAVSFKGIVIDGTGVVPRLKQGADWPDVKTQIKKLTDVVYAYRSDVHEPPAVKLTWGSFIFHGYLQSMSVEYTLFNPGGEPLRAKVDLDFKETMSAQEEALRTNKNSPDLSHRVDVKAGDTLPLLCYRIYGDSSYYRDVAGVNNLGNFRDLKPGTRLLFPPLV